MSERKNDAKGARGANGGASPGPAASDTERETVYWEHREEGGCTAIAERWVTDDDQPWDRAEPGGAEDGSRGPERQGAGSIVSAKTRDRAALQMLTVGWELDAEQEVDSSRWRVVSSGGRRRTQQPGPGRTPPTFRASRRRAAEKARFPLGWEGGRLRSAWLPVTVDLELQRVRLRRSHLGEQPEIGLGVWGRPVAVEVL